MRKTHEKRTGAVGVPLVLILLFAAVSAVYLSLFGGAADRASSPSPVPVITASVSGISSPVPTATPDGQINPIERILAGFNGVWDHALEQAYRVASKDQNAAILSEAMLSLSLSYADIALPAKRLDSLMQSGANAWQGQSVQKTPLPAFIAGSGETYVFGINAPEPAGLASASSLLGAGKKSEEGEQWLGVCDVNGNKMAYRITVDGELVSFVEVVQSGPGYLAQIYRAEGGKRGLVRLNVQLSRLSWAYFPDAKGIESVYDKPADWDALARGAQRAATFSNGEAELNFDGAVQTLR